MKNTNFLLYLLIAIGIVLILLVVLKPSDEIQKYREQIQFQNSIIKDQNERIVVMNQASNKLWDRLNSNYIIANDNLTSYIVISRNGTIICEGNLGDLQGACGSLK